ncbi:hypothetical protein LCGC14_2221550, partial [marine sediment metagenome]
MRQAALLRPVPTPRDGRDQTPAGAAGAPFFCAATIRRRDAESMPAASKHPSNPVGRMYAMGLSDAPEVINLREIPLFLTSSSSDAGYSPSCN